MPSSRRSSRYVIPVGSSSASPGPSRRSSSAAKTFKVDELAEVDTDPINAASTLHIWALGMVVVMGGQLYGWNVALTTGFLPFFLSQVLTDAAYVVYMSSAAEVAGKIAFSGGSYGLARITIGYYAGFLVGYLELLEYIAASSVSVSYVSNFVVDAVDAPPESAPAVMAAVYAGMIGFFLLPGWYYWRGLVLLAVLCLLPALLAILGGVASADLGFYGAFAADRVSQFNGTGDKVWAMGDLHSAYFAWLPYTTWAFAGIESLTLVTSMASTPKTTLPRGILAATATLFVTNIALLLIVPAQPPGIVACTSDTFPLNTAMAHFGISDAAGQWLILPAQVGMAAGFILPYTRLTQALANSNLLPPILGLKHTKSLAKPMVFASFFGYLLCLLGYFALAFESSTQNIFILAGTFCYGAQLLGFVMLRTRYHTESNGFVSPFGLGGVVFAGIVFGMIAISIVGGFQGDDGIAAISLMLFVILLSVYYHGHCKHHQSLSKDEYASTPSG
ncbi:hypothetical protein SDRG_08866 [Saprolegnia diclina VS20]|uniref:Amino acid permease/ SLC12A domain-containing protein n=1 Tax=Saprolegnia diclina (strain VS20) TaxID=1156394 RepID=T0Q7A8_SAPDV|nr:hypothetical protein SDRG_08866 [Saprolegnia diclina VS20]EQC33764.1 hypothetical protein SDRG_08866 [Saprolegnia diclina VS20]|eukprot:XP_008612987.1 hypothetical protein SDRG_08866 [Saprolegnia diclina VS20]